MRATDNYYTEDYYADMAVESAKYTDCTCGHSQLSHRWDGKCTRQRTHRPIPKDLPAPAFTCHDGHEGEPPLFCWPSNWPDSPTFPEVTEPCPCKKFYEWTPSEPDGW